MKSNATTRLMVRNVSHLGIGQVASTALGILLTAVIGRALEPAQLGVLYIVFAITSFLYLVVDWGQSTYLVKEVARGRIDEPELIGSALLLRALTTVPTSAIAVVILLALGYSKQIVGLSLLAQAAAIPATFFWPFDYAFKAKNRMDLDAFANIVMKAMTLFATAIALRFGGGLTGVILMAAVGNFAALVIGVIAAKRLEIRVKAPMANVLQELFWHGAPIAAFLLLVAFQPFLEIMLLSACAGPTVVGWYGAFRSIFGVIASPAMIMAGAAFPELSRTSPSVPDLRRLIDATGRVLFLAAAFASSTLYLFADHIVAILYGHGRFEQTTSILRVSAIFIPLLFFTYLLSSVLFATNRSRALTVLSIARIAVYAVFGWLLVGYWQQRFGNGAIALVIIAGVTEIPTMIAYLSLLPKGAVGSTTMLNLVRSYACAVCTVVPLLMLQPIGLWYLVPLVALAFALIAVVTRLILPNDLRLAMEVARGRVFVHEATKSAPDGGAR